MRTFTFASPDGKEWDVQAENEAQAIEYFNTQWQQLHADEVQKEFDDAPWYAKAGQSADDMVRMAGNAASFGLADRLSALLSGNSPEAERQKTEDARTRAGFGPSLAAEMFGYGSAGRMLPSGIAAAERLGGKIGGNFSKWLLGSGTSAAEGAAMGAFENAVNEQDPEQGGVEGALGGVAGNTLAHGIRAGIKGGQYIGKKLGILADDTAENLPPPRKGGRVSKAVKLRNEATDVLDTAVRKATNKSRGGGDESFDSALSTQLNKILDDPKKSAMFPPDVLAQIERARDGDFSTWLGRKLRKVGQAQYVVGAAGSAIANTMAGGSPLISGGILSVPAVGLAGRRMANQGSKRLISEAQRTMKGTPSMEPRDKLAEMLRGLGL